MSVYDSDDARGRSPGLEPIYYSLKPQSQSPPRQSASPTTRSFNSRKLNRNSYHANAILIQYIDENQPEIALAAESGGIFGTDSESPDDTTSKGPTRSTNDVNDMELENKLPPIAALTGYHPKTYANTISARDDAERVARGAVQLADAAISSLEGGFQRMTGSLAAGSGHSSFPEGRTSRSQTRAVGRKRSSQSSSCDKSECPNCNGASYHQPSLNSNTCGAGSLPDTDYRAKRPRESATESHMRSTAIQRRGTSIDSQASIATSPNLQEFVIHDADMPRDLKLPAMVGTRIQEAASSFSPPESLPSVSQLGREQNFVPLRQRATSNTSMSHGHSRSSSRNTSSGHHLLSPFLHSTNRSLSMTSGNSEPSPLEMSNGGGLGLSPASSQGLGNLYDPHHRRVPPRQGQPPFLTAAYHSSGTSIGEGSVPSLSGGTPNTSTSSDGYTPSTMVATPSDNQTSIDTPQSGTYVNYPGVPIGGYKCNYGGCEAQPFATQYLLNSHTNVHSQERPHFCEIAGCPRSERGKNGEGGKGFKRKNEMVRHGLVHESPGYICPWCPDRAHKYPRPDNLQRHVRMHHDDKDKEDPGLRDILNQRFTPGASRGRKKRG